MIFDHNVIFEMNIYCIIEGSLKKNCIYFLYYHFFFSSGSSCSKRKVSIENKCTIQICYCFKKIIVKSLNTCSVTLHFENTLENPNLLASRIFCLSETRINNVHLNLKVYNALSQTFHVLSCYDEHDITVFYDDNVSLTENTTITNCSVKFITALFNDST